MQTINAIYMYLYLRYYQYRLVNDTHFMIKEAIQHGVFMAPKVKDKPVA